MRFAAAAFVVGVSTIALAMLGGAGEPADTDDGERRLSKNDRHINASARRLIEEGRQVFRFDTFGSEAFFGDALGPHKAIAGEKHDTAKLFGFPYQATFDDLELLSLVGVAGVLEVAGGLLLGAGLYTRPIAFVLSGMMAVAYFMAHASQSNVIGPTLNGGELAALYSFIFLLFAVTRPGALSLDARKGRGSASRVRGGLLVKGDERRDGWRRRARPLARRFIDIGALHAAAARPRTFI
jgi:putative oxidoreductase